MKCKNCAWARVTPSKGYVGCIANLPYIKENPNDVDNICGFYERDSIEVGWVCLQKRIGVDYSQNCICGLTNGIPVFKEDDVCKHFKNSKSEETCKINKSSSVWYQCNKCKHEWRCEEAYFFNYCPNCGKKVVKEW